MTDPWLKHASELTDDEARQMAMEFEVEADIDGRTWGNTPAGFRRYLERMRAANTVERVLEQHPELEDKISANRERVIDEAVRSNRQLHKREQLRREATKEGGKLDLAELFIEDPERANRLYDQIYGD